MYKKRGQITVFMIVGIILVIAAAITIYVRESSTKTTMDASVESIMFSTQVQPIRYYVSSCLDLVLNEGLRRLGEGGGVIYPPRYNIEYQTTENSYYTYFYKKNFYDSTPIQNILPPLEEGNMNMKDQLKTFILEDDARRLRECLDGFVFFEKRGLDINKGDISVNVNILEDGVAADLVFPLLIQHEGKTALISKFSALSPVKLRKIRQQAEEIVDNVKECEETIYDELLKSVNSCGTVAADEQLIEDTCKFDGSTSGFFSTIGNGLSDGYSDMADTFRNIPGIDPEDRANLDELYDILDEESVYGDVTASNDISLVDQLYFNYDVFAYNHTLWTLSATFCKEFDWPIGKKCKHIFKTTPVGYLFLHKIEDTYQKSSPYKFKFATRRNYDIILEGEINCN